MPLSHDHLLLCYKILHKIFREDLHIARPLIQMLLQDDQTDLARNLALSTARRMLAIGNASNAIGFLTICLQMEGSDKEEINALIKMAQLACKSPEQVKHKHSVHKHSHAFALIEQLSDGEGLSFLKQGQLRHFEQGEDIVRQGETSQTFFLILDGEVDVHISLAGAPQKKMNTLKPGHFFGEFACVFKLPRSATITARKKILLLEFSNQSIDELITQFPLAGDYLIHTVQSRMVHAMTYNIPAFAELPNEDRLWAAEKSTVEEYQDGQEINQDSESCHILLSGKAVLKLPTGEGYELKAGSMFGSISPYIQLPCSNIIKTRERTLVCKMPGNIFHSFMNVYSSFEQSIKLIGQTRSRILPG